jgi:hypothetical protein
MFHQSMIIKIKAVGGVGCGCEQREKTFPLPRLSDQQIAYDKELFLIQKLARHSFTQLIGNFPH